MKRTDTVPAKSRPATKRPQPKGGSRKGVPNKTTATLKEAILLAAEEVGQDGNGKEGLKGYLKRVAQDDVKAFATLLGKVLPLQVTGPGGEPLIPPKTALTDERLAAIAALAAGSSG